MVAYLSRSFSPRQPSTVAPDIGFPVCASASSCFVITLVQELVGGGNRPANGHPLLSVIRCDDPITCSVAISGRRIGVARRYRACVCSAGGPRCRLVLPRAISVCARRTIRQTVSLSGSMRLRRRGVCTRRRVVFHGDLDAVGARPVLRLRGRALRRCRLPMRGAMAMVLTRRFSGVVDAIFCAPDLRDWTGAAGRM